METCGDNLFCFNLRIATVWCNMGKLKFETSAKSIFRLLMNLKKTTIYQSNQS